jgi:hypothetical protein
MRRTWLFSVLALLTIAARSPRDAETPRATDLLRARRLAERKEELLRLPRPESRGWLSGGGGWDDGGTARRRGRRRAGGK